MIAGKKFFFGLNKRLRTQFFPAWDGAQNIFLAFRHRKIFDLIARETGALMAAEISFFYDTAFNSTHRAIPVNRI